MKVEYINPFIASLNNAFQTMLGCAVHRGPLSLKDGNSPKYEISGIIGLSGMAIGTVVLSLSEAVALKAASVMLMSETTRIDADVVDAVGELTNMVAGRGERRTGRVRTDRSACPTSSPGADHNVRFPSNVTPICVPFDTAWGPLALGSRLRAGRGRRCRC